MTPPAPFPWAEVLHVGLGVLHWTPDAFWRATPREFLAAALPPCARGGALGRAALADLMTRFPDQE